MKIVSLLKNSISFDNTFKYVAYQQPNKQSLSALSKTQQSGKPIHDFIKKHAPDTHSVSIYNSIAQHHPRTHSSDVIRGWKA